MSNLILPDRELHTWQLSLDVAEDDLAWLSSQLSTDERARAAGFHFERDRRRFAAGRGLMRCTLASYLGCSPTEISFVYGARGKPALVDSALHFNLAHSDSLAVIGVTASCPVGIDVERLRPIADFMGIASRFFSPREREAIAALPPGEQLSGFFTCWTRKEAYLKATGAGMGSPLEEFDVPVTEGSPPQLRRSGRGANELGGWTFWDLPLEADYVGVAALMMGKIDTLRHRVWRGLRREGRGPTGANS